MSGKTRKYMIRNEQIQKKVKVDAIVEKLRKNHLRWSEYIQCRSPRAPLRKCHDINLNQARDRGQIKVDVDIHNS